MVNKDTEDLGHQGDFFDGDVERVEACRLKNICPDDSRSSPVQCSLVQSSSGDPDIHSSSSMKRETTKMNLP